MDDPKWLRLMTIGLVLAAIAVGYLLFTGAFAGSKVKKVTTQNVATTPLPVVSMQTASPSANGSAYNQLADRSQANTQTLPNTGFPEEALALISIGVATVGWGLRKYPN